MSDTWGLPPARTAPALPGDEVHVWLTSLDSCAKNVASFEQFLEPEERARAARYRFSRDRDRFVARRGLLRQVLASYLDEDPTTLRFASNAHGKPRLDTQRDGESLTFNLSDSHGLAVYAITRHRGVGIDLERIDPATNSEDIAERFFSPREVEGLRALPKRVQPSAFFTCWTRKEAYLKARGEGLSLPLDRFEVSVGPDEPAALLWTTLGPRETSRWRLTGLPSIPGYAAALCVEGYDWQLRCWRRLPAQSE